MWDTNKPHFLVGFDPSFCSERLNIPPKFTKHIKERESGAALLVGPSGDTWYAGLVLLAEGLFFNDGWQDFVRDHFLELGDSLVFRYDGGWQFTVQVFDQNMCEKETSFSAKSSQALSNCDAHVANKRERERLALLDSIVEGVPKKARSFQLNSECAFENRKNCLYMDFEEDFQQAAGGNKLSKNSITVAALSRAMTPNDNSGPCTSDRTNKLDMLLSASEAERIARSFASSFPNFTKMMKQFNISGSYTLNVPYQFAMEHLPNCKVKIVLHNLKGDSWTVNSIPTTKVQTSHTFCGGWLGFVRDNNIDLGDICIFELVRPCELLVRIIRVGKDGKEIQDGQSASKGRANGSSTKSNRRKLKKISAIAQKLKGSGASSQTRTRTAKSEINKKLDFLDEQGSYMKGCMSMKSAPEEKIAAQSFVSSLPHFVRVMKKFNVSGSYTLKIPYQFSMEHLPSCRTEIVLHNLSGRCWTVNSIVTTKVQTLHTFCGGWMAFVRDNDIQIGDICIFELVDKCEMRVHICGIGKKTIDYQNGTRDGPMS